MQEHLLLDLLLDCSGLGFLFLTLFLSDLPLLLKLLVFLPLFLLLFDDALLLLQGRLGLRVDIILPGICGLFHLFLRIEFFLEVNSDEFDHLLCRTALEPAVVLLRYRVEPVLYHVLSPHPVQSLRNTRPFCTKLARQSEQLDIFFDGPLLVVDHGVEVIVPHLPTVVGSSEELLIRATVEIVADITPLSFEAVFPE